MCKIHLLLAALLGMPCSIALEMVPSVATALDPDLVGDPTCVESAALSPDGKQFAYLRRSGNDGRPSIATRQLAIRNRVAS